MNELTLKQKVRYARRCIRKEMELAAHVEEELSAFHVPSECLCDVYRGIRNSITRRLNALGLTYDVLMEELNKCAEIEGQYMVTSFRMNLCTPAHGELVFVDTMIK